jgi:hypothetical protein
VVFSVTAFLNVRNGVLQLFKKEDSIGDSVYNSLLIIMLVNCTGVPVLEWLDTPEFVQYLHKWEEFQVGNRSKFLEFSVDITNQMLRLVLLQQHEALSLLCLYHYFEEHKC